MNFRKSLLSTAALVATSSLLVMGGCSPKDKGESAQISVEAAPLGLTSANEAVFARHFDVKPRKVSEGDASKALKAFKLDKEGVMNWTQKSGAAGNYVYTSLGTKTKEGEISIAQAELVGVHMDGDEASFDRVNFQGMRIKGDDVELNIGAMSIAKPSPKMAQAIITALQTNEGFDDLEVDWDEGHEVSFGAISIDDIGVNSKEVKGLSARSQYGRLWRYDK